MDQTGRRALAHDRQDVAPRSPVDSSLAYLDELRALCQSRAVREPRGAGRLSPRLSGELFAALGRIAHDVSILMVEQNARRALAMADRAYLLVLGRIVGEGEADLLARDSAVARSYLGL